MLGNVCKRISRICLELKEGWWKESEKKHGKVKCFGVELTDIAGLSLHKDLCCL